MGSGRRRRNSSRQHKSTSVSSSSPLGQLFVAVHLGDTSMEGKRSPSGFSTTSSSLPSELFGRKDTASSGNSGSSGLFGTVFSTTGPSVGKGNSSRSEIFGPYGKQDSAYGAVTDAVKHGSPVKGHNFLNKDRNSTYRGEKADPFSLSSSLYYGGQDIYSSAPSSYNSGLSYNHRPYKKDGEDDSSGSPVDSRGDWWQGSLYY